MSSALAQHEKAAHELPRATVAGAVASLTKWMRARAAEAAPNLLTDERDDLVVLQLSLRRVPASPTTKPHLLPLPHPVVAHSSASVCVISDDRAGSGNPAASAILDAARSLNLPVSEVIPFSALRTDYRAYESRRRFAASYDLFLADRALLPMLPRILGKAFYSTKKAPIAVNLARAGWPDQFRKVLNSTFLYLRSGTCSGIKVGRLDMEETEIVDNVIAAVEAAVEKVPKRWSNVRALHLKAVDSVALPIYQAVPELGMKIEVPVGQLEGGVGSGEVIDAAEVETGRKRKGKKMKALKNADANDGAEVAKEETVKYKRKRNKKEQTGDVVMEEVQRPTEKRSKRETVPPADVSADEGLKVLKKGNEKTVPPVDVSADEGLKVLKKGKEKKRALEKEVEDASLEGKGKKSEHALKEAGSKKRRCKEGCKHAHDKEEKNSKEKKSSGDKMKKRTRARV